MTAARILPCTTAQYHADPCATPSLSASIARVLVAKSPLHAWQAHPRLGGGGDSAASKAMDEGSLLHALILDQPLDAFAVLDFDDFRKGAAREAREGAEALGQIVVLKRDFDKAAETARILKDRLGDLGIAFTGSSEVKVEWEEQIDGVSVLCRGMMDHVIGRTILDLKTTRSGDLKSIARSVYDYGYDIQGAAYRSALGKLHPEFRGKTSFVLAFVETVEPFAVTPVELDGQFEHLGQVRWETAVRKWARCLKTNTWPGYVDGLTAVEPPPWAMSEVSF